MNVSFGGMGEIFATFKTDGTVNVGTPVQMAANGTVKACGAGDRFMGIATAVTEDGYATVQVNGYTESEYDTAPAVGYSKLSVAVDGKVTADGNGVEHLVLTVDTANKTVGFII